MEINYSSLHLKWNNGSLQAFVKKFYELYPIEALQYYCKNTSITLEHDKITNLKRYFNALDDHFGMIIIHNGKEVVNIKFDEELPTSLYNQDWLTCDVGLKGQCQNKINIKNSKYEIINESIIFTGKEQNGFEVMSFQMETFEKILDMIYHIKLNGLIEFNYSIIDFIINNDMLIDIPLFNTSGQYYDNDTYQHNVLIPYLKVSNIDNKVSEKLSNMAHYYNIMKSCITIGDEMSKISDNSVNEIKEINEQFQAILKDKYEEMKNNIHSLNF